LPGYHYSYLIGTLIFAAAWVMCFLVGKSYRPQMIWGTLVSAPFALTSLLFIPQYWSPPSLFDLDQKIHVGIEDFLWAAAVGGIASVVGEIILKEKLAETRGQGRKRHLAPFIVLAVVFGVLEFWHPNKTIYNMVIAFTIGAIVVIFVRRDLVLLMLTGALNFTVLYALLFVYFLALYPDFIQRYYNIPNLLGIYIFKVPIEELMFASSGGAIWSIAYEYLQGYRLVPGATFRLAPVERP
jgi:lycopene cyclase-like protein